MHIYNFVHFFVIIAISSTQISCYFDDTIYDTRSSVHKGDYPKFSNLQRIENTDIAHGLYYCLFENNFNRIVRFDGKHNSDYGVYGLYYERNTFCDSSDRNWFKVELEEEIKNVTTISLKNIYVDAFMSNYGVGTILSNSKSYANSFNLIINNNGYINLRLINFNNYFVYDDFDANFVPLNVGLIYGTSSSGIANLQFNLANYNLYASIHGFSFDIPNDILSNATITRSVIFSKSIIENNSPANLIEEIAYVEKQTETVTYEFSQNTNSFSEIDLETSNSLEFVHNSNIKVIDLSVATEKPKGNKYISQNYLQFSNNFYKSIKKTIEIPSNTSVSVEAYLELVNGLDIPFTAEGEIFGKQENNELPGFVIESELKKKFNYEIKSVKEKSVIIAVNGTLNAYFSLNSVFNLKTINKF